MSKRITGVSASTIRNFFNENPTLVPDGDKSVGPNWTGRGRLSVAAREVAEANGLRYEQGSDTPMVEVPTFDKNGKRTGRKVSIPLSEARTLAGQPKGRLSAASVEKAGQARSAAARKG